MQEAEGGGREPDHGEGTWVPLAPRQLLVKSRAVGHISTSTKHAKSLCVQIEAATRSVLSLNFCLTEQTFGGGEGKERLFLVQSGSCSPFKLSYVQNTGGPPGTPTSWNKLGSWMKHSRGGDALCFSCNGLLCEFV